MLDIREIDEAIAELERREATFSGCSKLADLYTIRAHMTGQSTPYERQYSQSAGSPIQEERPDLGSSDFLRVVSEKDPSASWAIMDDLMDTLRVVNPKAYDGVMRKIKSL